MRKRLAVLPMHLVAEVGSLRIGIAHGDAESLAGWQFSQRRCASVPNVRRRCSRGRHRRIRVHAYVLPVMQDSPRRAERAHRQQRGGRNAEFPRHAFRPRDPHRGHAFDAGALRRAARATVVEAVPVRYDHDAWMARFDCIWPAGSPASLSYRKRIAAGPGYEMEQAVRTGARAGAFSRAA